MTLAAVAAGLSVWCAMPSRADRRCRTLFTHRRGDAAFDPVLAVTVLVPLAALVMLGPVMGVLVAVVATPAARHVVGAMESAASRRRAARLSDQLPTALDLMVATLDAGRPPADAFALVAEVTPAPLGDELALVGAQLAVGGDPHAVWAHLAGDPVLGPLGRAFRRAATSGMPVARVVSSVADEMRRERRAARRERSRRVGVRTAAPLGACFLPAFFLVGIVPTIVGVVGGLSLGLG
ncbi:type II secretion system F family protein [Aeromicrobium sp.]|uniref:type II secretion system F family protein n=1 Tax=Aeromicrobium sp. TaxID=1871063 RepID=UPI003C48D93A